MMLWTWPGLRVKLVAEVNPMEGYSDMVCVP